MPDDGAAHTKTVDSIQKDLQFLGRRRGGSDWYRNACALDQIG